MSVGAPPTRPEVPLDQLDRLDYRELLLERSNARIALQNVLGQLADERRRPGVVEDEGEDWQRYRAWRQRARRARTALTVRLEKIRLLLYCHQAERAHARQLARAAEGGPPPPASQAGRAEENARRRARVAEVLAEGGPDALLIRCRLLFTRAWSGVDFEDLPLGADDRETLLLVSTYLAERFGSSALKRALRDLRDAGTGGA